MSEEPSGVSVVPERVVSVDVLRGFDMFWIIGGAEIARVFELFGDNPAARFVSNQLTHREWEGCVFYDLIFPLFLFLVGVSIVFSMSRIVEREGAGAAHRRIVRRFMLMFLLGILYSGGLSKGIEGVRIMGVLQRLALGYFFGAMLFCHLKPKGLAAVCAGLLIGYWAWLTFVPVPGLGKTSFAPGENWTNYIDIHYLPLHKHDGQWDPEGILSTFPAVATCLLGIFAGLFLKRSAVPFEKKGIYLIGAGVALLVAGYLWGLQFPIIKKIWTSSYVLVAGGYSCIVLGVFHQVVDVWKVRAWTPPFLWIGSNALAIYLARNLFDFRKVVERFAGGTDHELLGSAHDPIVAIGSLGLLILLANVLYRKKIFIKV